MKILAIADAFIPGPVMAEAMSLLEPIGTVVLEWASDDMADLHHRVRRIERDGPTAESPPDAIWDHIDDVELLVTHMCPVDARLIDRMPKLRMIGVCRAGTENIDHARAEARGIHLYNVPGRNAVAVAEFTIGMMLAERRNIARAHASIVSGGWRKDFANSAQYTELSGSTVGLVGFGAIGRLVAERLRPFGARLMVHDPYQSAESVAQLGGRAVSLEELLRESDVVSLHARREQDEPTLIGAAELALMKPTAYLVNPARAYLVDTEALVEALRHNRIAGAAIDVFEYEPIDPDAEIRELDNVTLTPHLAGSTIEAFHHSPQRLIERIQADLQHVW